MTREIKFRGKTKEDQWIIGSYFCMHHNDARDHIHHFIIPDNTPIPKNKTIGEIQVEVQENTVGQFTGLYDKNGKEIYEGDIIKMSTAAYGDEVFRIGYEDSHIGAFCLCSDEEEDTSRFVSIFGRNYGYEPFYCEVIGNIHDNPELLKQEE